MEGDQEGVERVSCFPFASPLQTPQNGKRRRERQLGFLPKGGKRKGERTDMVVAHKTAVGDGRGFNRRTLFAEYRGILERLAAASTE